MMAWNLTYGPEGQVLCSVNLGRLSISLIVYFFVTSHFCSLLPIAASQSYSNHVYIKGEILGLN